MYCAGSECWLMSLLRPNLEQSRRPIYSALNPSPLVPQTCGCRSTGNARLPEAHRSRPVLRDVSLKHRTSEARSDTRLIGAGKSTLLALVAPLYDPNTGRVLVDGHDLLRSGCNRCERRPPRCSRKPSYSLRWPWTICATALDVTPQDVEAATRAANAHAFLEALPEGYATLVGERGG